MSNPGTGSTAVLVTEDLIQVSHDDDDDDDDGYPAEGLVWKGSPHRGSSALPLLMIVTAGDCHSW